MRYFIFGIILLATFGPKNLSATEACSRVAHINYQDILVDANASELGEGLRFYLEKDTIAREYLDEYQKQSAIHWPNALIGTVGTGIIFFGFFNSNSQDRQIYLITGSATILVNFLIAKTLEVANESNLKRSIEEYNKRNLPKIYFNSENNPDGSANIPSFKIGLAKEWSF